MPYLAPQARQQFFDSNGDPLVGGLLYTYEAGTTTPRATMKNAEGEYNTNPVVLDANGYCDIWLDDGGYKFVLCDPNDTQIWSKDQILSIPEVLNTQGQLAARNNLNDLDDVDVARENLSIDEVDNTSDADKPISTATQAALDDKVDRSIVTTKGDIYVATASGTLVRLPVGNNAEILVADSAEVSGVKWSAPASSTGFSTGDLKPTLKTTADAGWVMADDGTIGSAGSSATNRANADTQPLYEFMWDGFSDSIAPVTGGRGASAAADFAANKPLGLLKLMGSVLGIAGAGSGLTARTLGQRVGSETHSLTANENGTHTHTQNSHTHTVNLYDAQANTGNAAGRVAGAGYTTGPGSAPATNGTTATNQNSGLGSPHNNMQPTTFINVMIKL